MRLAFAAKLLLPSLNWICLLEPAASCKSQGLPLAYNRLSVRRLPTLAVLITWRLLDTLTKLAIARLPKTAFSVVTLPVKSAWLPDNSKLTVKLLVSVLLAIVTKLAVAKLPKLAFNDVRLPNITLPEALTVPATIRPVPVTVTILAFPYAEISTFALA